jgi:carbon-monoxide dehydrogenase medium subunit
VIPAEFDYFAPGTLKEATAILGRTPEAKVLAGGMSLIPAMKHRLALPAALVDVGRIPGLDTISARRGRILIGARVVHEAIGRAPDLAAWPIFDEAASVIGDLQVRNRGTFGGSLVHADPAGDWSAVFLALDGEVTVVGPRGKREIRAADFFRGMLQSEVEADEILTEVRLSADRKRCGTAYLKLRQPASGFALVGVAVRVVCDRSGRCEGVSVAITGVNPVPFRAESLEGRLVGKTLEDATLSEACASIEELDPLDDMHASADYRRNLASVFARRALRLAHERATA